MKECVTKDKSGSVFLEFDPILNKVKEDKELRHGLSAVVRIENTLWLANDETITLERLTLDDNSTESNHHYNKHTQFALSDYITLPVPPTGDPDDIEEIDIEGLDYRDGYLWLVGSHSLKRKKADKQTVVKNFEQLAKVTSDGNRYILARIPVVNHDGVPTLVPEHQQDGRTFKTAQLSGSNTDSELTRAIAHDNHLRAFLPIPGKDNGFDIEGLAVTDTGKVFVGLRGPVLRGWSVILQMELEVNGDCSSQLKMKSINPNNPHNPSKSTYLKHFLDLDGLGVRDLCVDGSDLLILAGPTMELDGPVTLFRWIGATQLTSESLVPQVGTNPLLKKLLDIPFGQRIDSPPSEDPSDEHVDHAEGISHFPFDGDEAGSIIVVYDATAKDRLSGTSTVEVDIFALPK